MAFDQLRILRRYVENVYSRHRRNEMLGKFTKKIMAVTLLVPVLAWGYPVLNATHTVHAAGPEEVAAVENEVAQAGSSLLWAVSAGVPYHQEVRFLLDEMTMVQVLAEEYARIESVCAGNGLIHVQPNRYGPIVIIPNAGDLSLARSNVSIRVNPDGEVWFIPRTQGQIIRVPMAVGDKVEGQEVLHLSLAEGLKLMAEGQLIWTAKDQGPFGNGHGLPGHIAACDPQYDPIYFPVEDEE
jgi:hypothetical protein